MEPLRRFGTLTAVAGGPCKTRTTVHSINTDKYIALPTVPYNPIITLHVSGRGERANSNAFTAWSNGNRSVTS